MKPALLVVSLLFAGTAQANGSMSLGGTVDGWFLPVALPPNGTSCRVELTDVAQPRLKWVERVELNAPKVTLWLDRERYVASHTYRMTLRCGPREVGRGLVHLGPAL
jgi:hypothetical protein